MASSEKVKVRIQGELTIRIDQISTMTMAEFEELDAMDSYDLGYKIQIGLTCVELDIDDGSVEDFEVGSFAVVKNEKRS